MAEAGPRPGHEERRGPGRDGDIAVIGVSGRYPQAEDLDEFWSNLRSGRDCVTEVPADRWKHDELYSPERGVPGKAYGRWGAFLDGVDRFDPLFFGISPREAEVMDPQQRLFLETAWRLLEGSGLTQERLERRYGRRVGVYVGSMYQMYQADDEDVVRSAMTSATSYNLIANRVSHAFGLEGPSLAVDSMCSSSLMAVHLACADLRRGESTLAIAGGVNLTLHPNKYLSLSQAEMLGSHPGSRSFRDGDGYLPAEGVGAVLLKPLTEALRDGDTIHAVIRGSASLHGGGANQFMRPSYGTQVNVLRRALEQAEVEPESIGYVEAAANGASLSDLVEVRALREVFSGVTEPVALGSVKSNLGHPEAASGIAQLSKVVLQLRHAELAPLVEVGRANPDLGLEGGPLRLCEGPSSWEPRRSGGDGAAGAPPRRALINSVGAGGSYVSMVVEAPPETGDVSQEDHGDAAERQLVVLSAKDTDRLRATARRLLDLTGDGAARPSLRDLAHTLQSGRDHLPERLAVVVDSLDELRAVLGRHLDTGPEDAGSDAGLHTGNAERDAGPVRAVVSGAAGEVFLSALVADRELDRLAALWTCGARIPWDGLHRGRAPRTLSLPTTAFQRGSYWVGRTWHPRTEGDGAARPVPGEPPAPPTPDEPSGEVDLRRYLESFFGEALGLAPGDLPFDGDLQSVGADSILWVRLRRALDADLGLRLSAREIAESPTLERVLARLEDKRAERSEAPTAPDAAEVPPSSAEPGADRVRAARTRALERFRRGEIGRDELKELMKKETTGA
ncbi:beta-ketoacyl synthase N-terminal-like domain-containing protein [Nocardiopsis halotolerans]|uniref:beta-ketoacyl synthase N-terminal-like domain-containing protein n=1 Tax=Nocardiopsis halotolerans TaxID=124252 RepID=UPI00373AEE57